MKSKCFSSNTNLNISLLPFFHSLTILIFVFPTFFKLISCFIWNLVYTEFEERQLLRYSLSMIFFFFFIIAFFTFHLKDVSNETWVKLDNINRESTYIWSDGRIFHYYKWVRGLPFRDKYMQTDRKFITIQVNRKRLRKWVT